MNRLANHPAKWTLLVISLLVLILAGCHKTAEVNSSQLLKRSQIDQLNKEAFINRYRNPVNAMRYADSALIVINDSLPQYHDGYLRACNNMAYLSFMLSDYDCVERFSSACWDSAIVTGHPSTLETERLIALLLKARVLQRRCNIAESYQILYDIDHSNMLESNQDYYLHDFALMEYLITQLTLNYYFRNDAFENMRRVLQEAEETRYQLRCDWAEDISLNYAMAHCYSVLCDSATDQSQLLHRALELCDETLRILQNHNAFDPYHLANVYQMIGLMKSDSLILPSSWKANAKLYHQLWDRIVDQYGFQVYPGEDTVLALFMESTTMFWEQDDPYQRIGAMVTTADYAMQIGDTNLARQYYLTALTDTSVGELIAPKFELQLYRGLIFSGASSHPEDLKAWTERCLFLSNYIKQNEKADFQLQQELNQARHSNHVYFILTSCIGILLALLIVVVVLLVRKAKDLQLETHRLQTAKQQDIERIANMETCLSVLRHDISPFFSYLQNKRMPPELYQEVLTRMFRTFENIKSWTTITLPSGLQFRSSHFAIQEVFNQVENNLYNPNPQLIVVFIPSPLRVWADNQLLHILLRNLVNNAIQHTDQGRVTISAQPYPDNPLLVDLTVSDTGHGMTDQEVDQLFRTDKTINTQNDSHHGFGLILCRYIIKKHDDNTIRGCRIWAESQPDKGSTFHCLVALDSQSHSPSKPNNS